MSKTLYFLNERHTLGSALREALERSCGENDLVSCTVLHPLDEYIQVKVPLTGGEDLVRRSLLRLKDSVGCARLEIQDHKSDTRILRCGSP